MELKRELNQCRELIDLQLYSKAAVRLSALAKAFPENHAIPYTAGRMYLEQGLFPRAIEAFSTTAALIPENDDAWRRQLETALALTNAGNGNWHPAERLLRQKRLPQDTPQTLVDTALLHVELHNYKEALNYLIPACAKNDAHAFYYTANIFYIHDKPDEAIRVLKNAVKLNPRLISAYALMGTIFQSQKRFKDSIGIFSRALAISPNAQNADLIHYELANSFYESGVLAQAIKHFNITSEKFIQSPLRISAKRISKNLMRNRNRKLPGTALEFPRQIQKRTQCVPATISNILAYWCISARPEDIARAISDNGVRIEKISGFLRKKGLQTVETPGTISLIKKALLREIPVIADEYFGMEGHLMAITGFDDNKGVFYAQDPNYYETAEITYREFVINWRQNGNWMLLTAPPGCACKLEKLDISADGINALALAQKAQASQEKALHSKGISRRKILTESSGLAHDSIKIRPDLPLPYRIIMENHFLADRIKDALKISEICKKKFKTLYWVWRYTGDALLKSGRNRNAIEHYERALAYFSADRELFENMAKAYGHLKNLKKAVYYQKKSQDVIL
ncbi:MAG: tetratricopeptide repeat protein [Planctomycetes bacterium]|nr:tetratricopeptide repeat protein [Planctomycetota bacterium]